MSIDLSATESQSTVFELLTEEASLLSALGRELASSNSWWGASSEQKDRSVIGVESLGGGRYKVVFRDVIGVLRLPSRQVHIAPKIPLPHFLYIARRSELAPRLSNAQVCVDQGDGFLEALASWFLDAAEKLLRTGLRSDYKEFSDEMAEVRGRLLTCETALCTLRGRAVAICEFEELSDDTPLNRVVRGACQRLTKLPLVSERTRSRGRQLAYRMDGIGEIRPTDTRVRVDRLSKSYSRAIPLAQLILSGCGISSTAGKLVGTAFLVKTPEIIEDGLRSILASSLPNVAIAKRRLLLGDSGLSMNPDLVFGSHIAVGDVKYRYLTPDWNRSDLNQVVAFATAFQCPASLLLGFAREALDPLPRRVPVGSVTTTSLAWVASSAVDPAQSAANLGAQVRSWYAKCAETSAKTF